MPKDEFDFEDPLELNGVALLTDDDTSRDMAECFITEFLRLGYHPERILSLFRNPHYLGPSLVLQNKGEGFVRELIAEVFAQWGRPFTWSLAEPARASTPRGPASAEAAPNGWRGPAGGIAAESATAACPSPPPAPVAPTDPLGQPPPELTL
jgi:hypothetical protein